MHNYVTFNSIQPNYKAYYDVFKLTNMSFIIPDDFKKAKPRQKKNPPKTLLSSVGRTEVKTKSWDFF